VATQVQRWRTVANRSVRGFRWGVAHAAPFRDARRFPSTRWYPVPEGLRVRRWGLGFVHQGAFFSVACQTLPLRFATFASL
jgi:hypothetical protein